MKNDDIPSDIRDFVVRYIDSIELLSVLLLLQRESKKDWSIQAIEKEMRSSSSAIEKRLNDLYGRKILIKKDNDPNLHRYQPYDSEMAAAVDKLAQYFGTYPNRIIELMFSRPDETLRIFANAFRIKRKDQ